MFWICIVLLVNAAAFSHTSPDMSMRFLVTVNDTWDDSGCIETVATPLLNSGVNYTQGFSVGSCDHGPLRFGVIQQTGQNDNMIVQVTFYSSVIEDASPPQCNIPWNGTYLVPTSQNPEKSLLPGCFVMDSREGYHMTYYWFHILEWVFH